MTEPPYYVVLIETSANQATIFQTNKLRENIGASQLIHRVGTTLVLAAIGVEKTFDRQDDLDDYVIARGKSSPITLPDVKVEIVIAVSGKAILLVKTQAEAERIIGAVTLRALHEAPGVIVRGVHEVVATWTAEKVDAAITKAHRTIETLRGDLPAADRRFQRLPFVEDCRSSGMPAMAIDSGQGTPKAERVPISAVIAAKRENRDDGWRRIQTSVPGVPMAKKLDELEEKGFRWTAIAHADGNGLGMIFLDFKTHAKTDCARTYVDKLRAFSLAIDRCTRAATKRAIDTVWPRGMAPVIPVVLGGDDLTVICDGRRAVKFAAAFLAAFEDETSKHADITIVNSGKGLTAAAGVAVVKPHFPFHRAYELAEALCKSAKIIKKHGDGSALDFQVLFDTSGADLEPIRDRMVAADDTRLSLRPYVVGAAASSDKAWVKVRRLCDLLDMMAVLDKKNPKTGRRLLPRNQQHTLLKAAYIGKAAAAACLAELETAYPGLKAAGFTVNTLYPCDGATCLLDAMELYDLEADIYDDDGTQRPDTSIAEAAQ